MSENEKPNEKPCSHTNEKLTDYHAAFHDGRVVCADCGKFIRFYDGG